MKNSFVILLITTFWSVTVYAQNPFKENTVWGTSERIDDEFEEVSLWPIEPQDVSFDRAYYQIKSKPNNQFEVYNIPGCGMDCMIRAFGSFTTTEKTVQFTIDKTMRFKRCSGEDILNKDIGTYYWIKYAYSLRLVKSLDDEPKQNYFDSLNIAISDFKNKKEKEIMAHYAYLYNRIYQIVANKNKKNMSKYKEIFLAGERKC